MKLIVGLGNVGKEYELTRHNIGFIVLNNILENWLSAENFSDWQENKKFKAFLSEGSLNGEKIILAKPTTFMNNSGSAVQAIMSYYKISEKNLIVIHDDLDLLFGNYKVQINRSSAGHNGINSIIEKLSTQDFTRIRIGIGKEDKKKQGYTADFVLNKFGLLERLKLKEIKEKITDEIKKLI